mgnify:CR=1 FL=1
MQMFVRISKPLFYRYFRRIPLFEILQKLK